MFWFFKFKSNEQVLVVNKRLAHMKEIVKKRIRLPICLKLLTMKIMVRADEKVVTNEYLSAKIKSVCRKI